jgi:hypothetical protein
VSGVRGMRWGQGLPDDELEPCGTLAAYRRHLRRGDPVDRDCREASVRHWHDRVAAGYVKPPGSRHLRVHLADGGVRAYCGRLAAAGAATADPGSATCVNCVAVHLRHVAKARKGYRRAA